MNKIIKILVIVLVALFLLGLAKNFVVQSVVSLVGSNVVGAPVRMSGMSLGVFNQAIKIKGFRLYNPSGFPKGVLIEIPKIEVAYDLGALLKGKLHLKSVAVDLKQTVIIKNEAGELNVNGLKVAKKQESKPSKPLVMQIDFLKLSIDKIVVKEFNKGEKPKVLVYEVGIKDKEYKNITSAQQLVSLILGESLSHTAIKGAQAYALSALAGVAFLPAAAAITFSGKDYSEAVFSSSMDNAFKASSAAMAYLGEITNEDKASGTISGKIGSTEITVKLSKAENAKTKVNVTARKYFFPEQATAAGLLYEIALKLR